MTERRPVIAVVGGTGHLGLALVKRFAAADFRVLLGSRSSSKAHQAISKLAIRDPSAVQGMTNASAAGEGEIVIVTVPYASHNLVLDEIRDRVTGKILVDTTVPLVPPKITTVQLPPEGSAALAAQKRLGGSVRVVSAFQNVAAHKLDDGQEVDCDVLVCGNDKASRELVIALISAIGLRALDSGPLANSAATEALTSVLISINRRYKIDGAGVRITGVTTTL